MTIREDRIANLVALCIKNHKNPQKTGFSDYIIQQCANKWCLSKAQAKRDYVNVLISAYRNRWRTLIENNPYLSIEEKTAWNQS